MTLTAWVRHVFPLALAGVPAMSIALHAQPLAVHGPVSGVLHHAPSHTIRQLMGVPGAAHYGLPLAKNADRGFPSPDGRYAIVTLVNGSSQLVDLSSPGAAPVIGNRRLLHGIQDAVWADDSLSAFVFSPSLSRLQLVAATAGGWTASDGLDVSTYGTARALVATLSSCSCAVLAYSDGTSRHLVILRTDGAIQFVIDVDPSSVFALDSEDSLYIASPSQVQRIRLPDGPPAPEMILMDPVLDRPTMVSVSRSENKLLVLNRDEVIYIYNLEQKAAPLSIRPGVGPLLIRKLNTEGRYYQLTEPSRDSDILYVLDVSHPSILFFVPAPKP